MHAPELLKIQTNIESLDSISQLGFYIDVLITKLQNEAWLGTY